LVVLLPVKDCLSYHGREILSPHACAPDAHFVEIDEDCLRATGVPEHLHNAIHYHDFQEHLGGLRRVRAHRHSFRREYDLVQEVLLEVTHHFDYLSLQEYKLYLLQSDFALRTVLLNL
jgi:hypothetical protein